MKKSLSLCIGLLLLSLGVFAGIAPESLSMKGSALAESSEALPMKKVGNGFELITALKTGSCSFEDGNTTLNSEVTIDGEFVPCHIEVNYDGETPNVIVNRINDVWIYAPWNQYVVSTMVYEGNSSFTAKGILYNQDDWGDLRYRFKLRLENGNVKTYASEHANELLIASNEQWGGNEEFPERSIDLLERYVNREEAFDAKIIFDAEDKYTYELTDNTSCPTSLYLKGSALNETETRFEMKRISNCYEIITSLKNGKYSFDGDSGIPEAEINGSEEARVYYVKVDYNTGTPEVLVREIIRAYLIAPWNKYEFADLNYVGGSSFTAKNIIYNKDAWGDARYRIRLHLEGDTYNTYGPVSSDERSLNIASNELSWGSDKYGVERNYGVPDQYQDEITPFDINVYFNLEGRYTHTVTTHIPEVSLYDEVWLEGSAVEGGKSKMTKSIMAVNADDFKYHNGVFEFVGGLQAGEYTIKASKDGVESIFTIEDGSLVEGATEIGMTGELTPYYIKIDFNTANVQVSPITSFDFWYMQNDIKVSLQYMGNGIYTGFNDFLVLDEPWWGLEVRYKYIMTIGDGSEIWWGRVDGDRMFTQIPAETSDKFEPAFLFAGQTRGRTTWTINFAADGNYTQEYKYANYVLEDKVSFNNPSAIENASIRFTRNGLGAGEYSTLYLPFATTLENIEIYAFSNSEENTINFVKVESIEANTPYLIKPTIDMDLIIEEENVTLETTIAESSVGDNFYHFSGTYENKQAESGMYGISPTKNSFVQAGDNVTIPAFRAYLQAIDLSSGAPSLAIGIDDGNTTDVLENFVEGGNVYAVNSTLYIVAEVQSVVNIYALDGRLVRAEKVEAGITGITGLQQGVYIANGQKVVIQ